MRRLALALLLAGCGSSASDLDTGAADVDTTELVWMEGAGFGWSLFNHRLSYLGLQLSEEGVTAAVVGGTSTTGVVTDLDPTCDPDTCDEFPFYDEADVRLHWARASAPVVVGRATAELVVGAEGGSTSLEIALEGEPQASTAAVIRGLVLDTNQALEGDPACYLPANGWLPRRISVSLGEPEVLGHHVVVPVEAAFEAGNTLDPERQCVDAVIDRARVRFAVDVLVVSGSGAVADQEVVQQGSYAYSGDPFDPGEQVAPAAVPLDAGSDEALVAWSALDWRFNIDNAESRGAYLRTLDFVAGGGGANGTATNYSPGTQLAAMDFVFTGTVRAVELGVPVERGTVEARIPVELQASGVPVSQELPLE